MVPDELFDDERGDDARESLTTTALSGRAGLALRPVLRILSIMIAAMMLGVGAFGYLRPNWQRIFPPPPYRGPIILASTAVNMTALRTDTGKALWTVRTSGDSHPVRDGETIIYSTTLQIFAIDRVTGKQRWHFGGNVTNPTTAILASAGHRVYVSVNSLSFNPLVRHSILFALDTRTGLPLWSFEIPTADIGSVIVRGDSLFVVPLPRTPGAGDPPTLPIMSLATATGAVRWSHPFTGIRTPLQVVVTDHEIAASDGVTLTVLDQKSGQTRWSVAAPLSLTGAGDVVIIASQRLVAAYESASGAFRWANIAAARIDGPLSIQQQSVLVQQVGQVTAYELASGRPRWTNGVTLIFTTPVTTLSALVDDTVYAVINYEEGYPAFCEFRFHAGDFLWCYYSGVPDDASSIGAAFSAGYLFWGQGLSLYAFNPITHHLLWNVTLKGTVRQLDSF